MVTLLRRSRSLFAAVSHFFNCPDNASALWHSGTASRSAAYVLSGYSCSGSRYSSQVATSTDQARHSVSLQPLQEKEQEQWYWEEDSDDEAVEIVTYDITVVTGSVRGAGTHNPCKLQLFGTLRASPEYMIGEENDDDHGTGFARDSIKEYSISCPKLGSLRRIHLVKSERSLTELGAGWFLEKINVSLPDATKMTFPCHAWLGQPDDDTIIGENERNLIPWIKPQHIPSRAEVPSPVRTVAAGLAIPHPDKLKMGVKGVNHQGFGFGGEDAYFYMRGSNGMFGMGVADGVYMWREQGIDSGVFSRTLMETSQHMVEAGYSDVLKMVQIASRKVESEGIYGSSTMCLVSVDQQWARIRSACIGDSGLIVIGSTPEDPKEHGFGHPYQLGHFKGADKPEDAVLSSMRVLPGDVLIVGSDGLFDNIFDRDICAMALKHQAVSKTPGALVRELVQVAYENSMNRSAFTPYSFGASEWFDMVYNGGKPDDIAVVAAFLR